MIWSIDPIKNIDRTSINASPIGYTDIEINANNTAPNPEFISSYTAIRFRIFGLNLDWFIVPIMGRDLCIRRHEILCNAHVNKLPCFYHLGGGLLLYTAD